MEDVYVARQPIFDRNKKIYAYELLFRDGAANYMPALDPLLALSDIIKFDFRLTPKEDIDAYLKQLSRNNLCLLAEKVETHDEFEAAQKMGYTVLFLFSPCPGWRKGSQTN